MAATTIKSDLRVSGPNDIGNERLRQAASRDSAMMLAALGILAYAASMMTHEAVGHGSACLAVGGHNVMLTAWMESCDFLGAPRLAVKAAGPGVQFGAGLLAWLVLHLSAPRAARLRYFLWLYMAFNLFISSSYVAFSGFTEFGDAAELIAGHQPRVVWRTGLVLLGSVVYFLSMQATALELKRFAGLDHESRRMYRLVWIPYVSAGVFACATAALNTTMGHGEALRLAALSSFASGAGLFSLPDGHLPMVLRIPYQTIYVRWSAAWGVVAAMVIMVFLFLIGPGLQ